MRSFTRAIAGALMIVLASPVAAWACGTLMSDDGRAELREFQTILSFDGSREEMLVSIGYDDPDPTDGAAWLMPFPSVPQVAEGTDDGLQAAFDITRPPLRSDHVPSVVPFVCGCGADQDEGGAGALISRTLVGDVELVTLAEDEVGEVAAWLGANGFGLHDRQRPVVEDYLSRGWVLVAARIIHPPDGEELRVPPIRFSFTTERAVYPMAMAGSDHTAPALRMSLLTVTPDRPDTVGYDATMAEPDGDGDFPEPEGLELRYSKPLEADQASDVARSVDVTAGQWLSRYEASLDPQGLSTDLEFTSASDQSVVDYADVIAGYGDERLVVNFLRILVMGVIAFPVILLIGGLMVVIVGLSRGGFKKTA